MTFAICLNEPWLPMAPSPVSLMASDLLVICSEKHLYPAIQLLQCYSCIPCVVNA